MSTINVFSDFEAAIFDFDGTLVDSLGVWRLADNIFMKRWKITFADDFYDRISHMSLIAASEYIVREYSLPRTPEQVEREFLDIVTCEYAERINMVAGAKEFLKRLSSYGVRLAIATASQEAMYRPCLERHGVYNLFDCVATLLEVKRAKGFPDVYLLAAKRLGIEPEKCVVFEDIYLGAVGAKAAGMSCIALREDRSRQDWKRLEEIADLVVDNFTDLL